MSISQNWSAVGCWVFLQELEFQVILLGATSVAWFSDMPEGKTIATPREKVSAAAFSSPLIWCIFVMNSRDVGQLLRHLGNKVTI